MDCFCGCGRKLNRRQLDLNLQASNLALELLAWDKARAAGRLGPPAADDAERLITQGADRYQRLLSRLHGESEAYSYEEGQEWLARSAAEREGRQHMAKRPGLLRKNTLRLTEEDVEQLDRAHPELSFTARAAAREAGSQLRRLEGLHAEGVLSAQEFAAAKARISGPD